MTAFTALDWALFTASLFNTILLIWLGLTVWFAADQGSRAREENRRWGVRIISAGSLIGALFFTSHTILLGFSLDGDLAHTRVLVQAAALPIVAIPSLWYAAILWYAGYGEPGSVLLRKRHKWWLRILLAAAVLLSAGTFFPGVLPDYREILTLNLQAYLQPDRGGLFVPVALGYLLVSSVLALDVLRRPGETTRLMGAQARRRARPWLVTTSVILVLASAGVLAGYFIFAFVIPERSGPVTGSPAALLGWMDLALSGLMTAGVVTLGQAVVAYEVFTGRSLPRSGFRRQWRRVLILAAGYSGLVGGALALGARPIVTLLLTTLLMTVFIALLTSRSFRDRELTIAQLRPFVSTGGIFDGLDPDGLQGERQSEEAFHALCESFLEASAGYLLPVGSMVQIVPHELRSPPHRNPFSLPLPVEVFSGPDDLVRAIEGADPPAWAVSLWGERGLVGLLVLEEKRGGGLYTLEEVEIARAFCERLLGLRASAALTRRLLELQRERLAESRVLDRQTRRILHDDILPMIHTAVLGVGHGDEGETRRQLMEVHREIAGLLRGAAPVDRPDVLSAGVIQALRKTLELELQGSFDEVVWAVEPETAVAYQRLSPLQREVLFYAARECLRNAARYGRSGPAERLEVQVSSCLAGGRLVLAIRDDGQGIEEDHPGVGNGQGLALHRTLLEILGGELVVDSQEGVYTEVRLALPGR